MIKRIIIFGEDAVREFNETKEIPSDKWIDENGGLVTYVEFKTQAEYHAYLKGLNDFDGWNDYEIVEMEIAQNEDSTPKFFVQRIAAIRDELLASIKETLKIRDLSTVDISGTGDATYVIWWDNNNCPNEGQVLKVCLDGKELSLEVDAEDGPVTIYESDFALENPIWLSSIYDNVVDVLNVSTE